MDLDVAPSHDPNKPSHPNNPDVPQYPSMPCFVATSGTPRGRVPFQQRNVGRKINMSFPKLQSRIFYDIFRIYS